MGSVLRCLTLTAATVIAGCSGARTFHCETDDDCVLGTIPGRCEVTGFCSFGDIRCSSGSRYGEHAPAGTANECVTPPTNDRCTQAAELSTTELASGTLRGGDVSGLLTCSPQAGAEVFYTVVVDTCSDIELRTEAPGGNLSLGLIDECTTLLACTDEHQTDEMETLVVVGVPAGTYGVAVGGTGYDEDFSLGYAIAPAPPNDTCASALVVGTTSLPVQTLSRSTDDGSRAGGRDVFYRVDLAEANNVLDVTATPRGATGPLAITLLDATCSELATRDASGGAERFHDLAAGSYYIAIDGPADGSCGQFDLEVVSKEVEPNNTCTHAKRIGSAAGEVSGTFTETVNLYLATADHVGSCGGNGNDLVYDFKLNRRARLGIRAVERTGGFTPTVYLRKPAGDCATAPEVTYTDLGSCAIAPAPEDPEGVEVIACDTDPSTANILLEELDPGDYQIVVDSDDGEGTADLTVEIEDPAGDTLGSAPLYEVGTCEVLTTVGAHDDPPDLSTCASGPEVYRTISLPEGCTLEFRTTVHSTMPHRVAITKGDCPFVLDSAGTPITVQACGGAPAIAPSGLYTSMVTVTASADLASACTLQVVITGVDEASARHVTVRSRTVGMSTGMLCLDPPIGP
jgi:hypothetical protein